MCATEDASAEGHGPMSPKKGVERQSLFRTCCTDKLDLVLAGSRLLVRVVETESPGSSVVAVRSALKLWHVEEQLRRRVDHKTML
jgi:hypothetical protein